MVKPPNPSSDILVPKLFTSLRGGYSWRLLGNDALAGLTVAIVALPLAMAVAIASGTSPERGLYTAIVAGFLISLLGGSRYQIGGPTAAFIVVVYATIERHGLDGLMLATLMAGFILIAVGLLRLGTYIKYIPYPVVSGFTAGIAVSIVMTQVRDLFGLQTAALPAGFFAKVEALWVAMPTADLLTIGVSVLSLGAIVTIRKVRPAWPAFLIAVALSSVVVFAVGENHVATIGSRFGGIPRTLPSPSLPAFSVEKALLVLPDALTIALLAGIESLLSAVIADGMTGRRHRSNMELVAQGIANIGSVLFGGISATGAIARTATNIRSGAHGPMSGILHAFFLLLFMLIAAPVLSYLPLAALGAVLVVVAWNMSDHEQFLSLLRSSWADRIALLLTFFLTVCFDLTVALQAGVIFAAFSFMHRAAEAVSIEDRSTDSAADVGKSGIERGSDRIAVFRIDGPFFFGTASRIADALERSGARPKAYVLDFTAVPFVDSTAANALRAFIENVREDGVEIHAAGLRPHARKAFEIAGIGPGMHFAPSLEEALVAARGQLRRPARRSRAGVPNQ